MPTTYAPFQSTPRTDGLPSIKPLPLTPHPAAFDDPAWLFEPKYDGFRGLVYASSFGCEIRSTRDLQLRQFVELWQRVGEVVGSREAILDGEVVALDRQGKPTFDNLVRKQGFLAFAAFDLLWLDGSDLREHPLSERKRLLGVLLPEDTGPLYKVLSIKEHGRALYSAVIKLDLEGMVAKRLTDPYQPGTSWYTISNPSHHPSQSRQGRVRRRPTARH